MRKLIVLVLLLATTFLSFKLLSSLKTVQADEDVWCHKHDNGQCREDEKDECDDEWQNGRCPIATPTPTATPTIAPTATPQVLCHKHDDEECEEKEKNHCGGEWHNGGCSLPSSSPSATPTEQPTSEPTAQPTTPSCGSDEHLSLEGTKCLKWELGGAPASAAATGGQVLGASTMAGTGVMEDTLFNMIFVLGSVLSAFGLRKFSKTS
jgi:hypothetical protein